MSIRFSKCLLTDRLTGEQKDLSEGGGQAEVLAWTKEGETDQGRQGNGGADGSVGAKERGCTSRAAEERAAVRVALGLLRDLGGVSGDPRLLQAHNRGWGMRAGPREAAASEGEVSRTCSWAGGIQGQPSNRKSSLRRDGWAWFKP